MSKSGTRIHWTPEEREVLVEAMVAQLRVYAGTRKVDLWAAGNAALAEGRRRTWAPSYGGKVTPAAPLFEAAYARLRSPQDYGANTPIVSEQTMAQVRTHVPMKQDVEVTWVPVPVPQRLDEVPLKELLAEVIERVILAATTYQQVAPLATPQQVEERLTQARAMERSEPAKKRTIRIAICGVLSDQFRRIKERLNGAKVEVVLVDNQREPTKQDWKGGIDFVIVTRFIRHGHQEQARMAVGRERVHWVQNGTEAIVAKVVELVPGASN
jgi:hypothetical protein